MLKYTEDGLPFYDESEGDIPSWVQSPFEIAASRTKKSVVGNKKPVEPFIPRALKVFGPDNPKRPSYVMEPDLLEAQQGRNDWPQGLMQRDDGTFYYVDAPSEPVPVIRRPNVLPFAATLDGYKFAMPKMLDIVGNVAGNVGGLAGGKITAKPGDVVLGSGGVSKMNEGKTFEVLVAPKGNNVQMNMDAEVLKNPTKLEALKFTKDYPNIRSFTDKEDDLYLWDAEAGTHEGVASSLGLKIKDWGDEWISSGKGELYSKQNIDKDFNTLFSNTKPQATNAVGRAIERPNEMGFFSTLERAVSNAKIEKGTPDQWLGYLKNQPGVKSEELEYVLKELLQGQITKQQLNDIVKENKVELKEIERREFVLNKQEKERLGILEEKDKNNTLSNDELKELNNYVSRIENKKETKYHSYQLPGGENYREMLLTLPGPKERLSWDDLSKNQHKSINQLYEDMRYDMGDEFVWKSPADLYEKLLKNQNELYNNYAPKNVYQSSHWDDPDVLTHIRMNDRVVDGNKTLHLEEIQSDWHQAGRKQGYKLSKKERPKLETNAEAVDKKLIAANRDDIMGNPDLKAGLSQAVKEKLITQKEADDYLKLANNERSTIPDAPFKKNWDELALKRMIRKASEEGYDAISWTPGEAQAARYDLSKQIKGIHWQPSPADKNATLVQLNPTSGDNLKLQVNKTGKIVAGFPSSRVDQWEGKNLADVIGKEHAEKILAKADGSLEGEGLKVGGEGMKSFYDKMLVDKANAIAKKYGGKVEQKFINQDKPKLRSNERDLDDYYSGSEETDIIKQPIHFLKLTPELKKKAMEEGFPLFSQTPVLNPVDFDPFKDEKKKFKLVPVEGNPFQ